MAKLCFGKSNIAFYAHPFQLLVKNVLKAHKAPSLSTSHNGRRESK